MQRTQDDSPIINICHYRRSSSRTVYEDEILTNPGDNVVLKRALDDLVEEIRAQQFVDISAGKSCCEWLYCDVISSTLQIIG